MHLQDAYFSEKGDTGTGDEISYKAPPKNVFDYDVTGKGVFEATSATPLDECGVGSKWNVTGVSGSKSVKYTATTDCLNLTPNFTLIGAGS